MKKNSIGTALITGAAQRIGKGIALYLAEKGFDIVISYKTSEADAKKLATEIKEKFKVKCEIFCSDLSDLKQTEALAKFMSENFSNWNLLVNNASIFRKSNFLDEGDKELMENFNIHLFSPMLLSKALALHVKKNKIQNSQIINMVDKNIVRFETSYADYVVSKKSLAEFTQMFALEAAPEVRVNGIAPGYILESIDSSETEHAYVKKIPLQKKGEIKNILQTIGFLLENDFVTGQILFIDGGASLNHAG